MTSKAKFVVCSEILTRRLTQCEHHVQFELLNLVVRKETAGLWKVNPL